MKTLIGLGATISLKDNDSRNVLHAAVIHGGDLDRILDDEACVSLLCKVNDEIINYILRAW